MKTPGAKSRGWLVTLSAASVLLVYLVCVFIPGHKSTSLVRRQLAEKRQAVLTANLQAQSLPTLEGQLQRATEYVRDWRQASPAEPHAAELLGKFAALAQHSNVRVHRLSPEESVPMPALRQHSLTLEVEGDFLHLVDFLGRLESLPETLWVRQLKMKPSGENGKSVQCDLMLTVFADNREVSG